MERQMRAERRGPLGIGLVLGVGLIVGAVAWPGPGAQAQVAAPELVQLRDKVVILERKDGRWLEARILKVQGADVVVQLEDGTTGRIPIAVLARVRRKTPTRPVLRRLPPRPQANPDELPSLSGPGYRPPPTAPGAGATTLHRRHRPSFYVEWIGLRTLVGFGAMRDDYRGDVPGGPVMGMIHLELVAFALHWKYFYWEILRGGGGEPFLGHVGTAMAYPIRLGQSGEHELRIGAHLTLERGYKPGASGAYLVWSYRPFAHFGFHLGLMQHSWPAGLSVVFGFSA